MKRKLARGVVWVGASRVLVNLIGLASTLLLARFLLPEDFGLVAIAGTVVAIVASITELSLSSALIQHEEPGDHLYDTAFTLNAGRSLLLGLLIAAVAWPFAAFYGDPRLVPIMLVVAATSALSGLGNPRMVTFTRRLVFWQDFVLQVASKLIGFLVAVAIAYAYRSYWALVISNAVVQLLGLALSYALVRYRPRFSLSGWRDLMGFSIWLSASQAVNTLNWQSDSLLVGYFLGNQRLGYYNYGSRLASLPTNEATAPIAQTLFPAFSRMTGEGDRLRHAYQQAQTLMFAIAFPAGVGLALIADPMVRVALGEKWLPAVMVIQVLAPLFGFLGIPGPVQPLAMAMGATKLLFKRDLFNLVVRLPMIVAGMLVWGLIGVVWARVAIGIIGTVVAFGLVKHLISIPVRQQILVNARALLATGIMVVAVIGCGRVADALIHHAQHVLIFKLFLSLFVGLTVYPVASFLLWHISGRPAGPEQHVALLLHKLVERLRTRNGAPSPIESETAL